MKNNYELGDVVLIDKIYLATGMFCYSKRDVFACIVGKETSLEKLVRYCLVFQDDYLNTYYCNCKWSHSDIERKL